MTEVVEPADILRRVTAYDEVRYTGRPYADAHPERLATMAMLHGVKAASVERCRVLEIACGDGANLIPMAHALPGSQFVGFDLAAQPIEAGKRLAAQAGVSNLALSQLDLTAFPADAGAFDYVIAHGLYSWIPQGVRESLLALIARHLAPFGVAFVSYNVYPGCYVRRMVWEMLKFHTEPVESPSQRIAEAKALAQLLAQGRTVDDPYTALMRKELERYSARDAGFLFHDDLAGVNDPCWFHEFAAHAEAHGLQFLCEAELVATAYTGLSDPVRHVLDSLEPMAREQYLDFAKCRRFRQTLLCRGEVHVEHGIDPARLAGMRLASRRRGLAGQPDAAEPPPPEESVPRAILDALDAAAPQALSIDELAQRIPGTKRENLLELCFAAARAGAVQPHVHAPALGTTAGSRPVASAVARAQVAQGTGVTSLRHVAVDLDDELARRILPLLDGTLDAAGVAAALGESREAVEARIARLDQLGLIA